MLERIPAELKCKLPSHKQMSDTERGIHVEFVRYDFPSLVKWLDKKCLILLSTDDSAEPIECCKRWSKTEIAYITVPRSALVKTFKENMVGVNHWYRLLSYRLLRT